MTAREVGRVGARKLLQRSGIIDESISPLSTDAAEVAELMSAPWYDERLAKLAAELGRDPDGVRAEAAGYLREMAATLDERAVQAWRGFSRWLMRAYDVLVDEDQIAQVRKLDRKATLAFAFSHRSYLDGMLLPEVIQANRLSPALTFGGANLNFFPMGAWAKRTGAIFIRRQTKDIPVYRFVLRAYAAQLVQNHANLTWSIEGGRTRTGKLRPPVFGILRYIADAVDEIDGPEVYLVPTSIVYDQLHEVEAMTTEAYGAVKRPEDLRFLVRLARQQGERLGRAYLDFGEPLPLRKRLEELRTDESGTGTEIERIALDVEHRINRATPVTPTAVVSLALLGADRSLSISEVLATVRPLASYIAARNWAVAGAADLTNRSTIRWTLHQMVASGVVRVYDAGTEAVWGIGEDQHLVAAFYRNTAIHILVDRAIAEMALLAAAEISVMSADSSVAPATVRDEALRLRELLKFEFLFSARVQFEKDLADEVRLIGPVEDITKAVNTADVRELLESADLLLAHLVLRPFLDAYHIVADRLAALEDESFDEEAFLAECLDVGKQWELQRRIANAESRSMELFKTALRLGRHRELVDGADFADISRRRRQFADEVATATRRVNTIAELARTR
ncbi:lysophospholipid acyltransferase [Mycobacterium ulcerans]|uniref:Acyltransferase, PlsB1 n=2 Tax=Mycobacterium ulcerans TaxID=1809 RepID=A0PNY9_MYCUA|nr:lysophospholipid acyltransferase [Mycobacterium ulcerans]ABL04058.1 acyltransferase, PlsB1 [Mycobacterium ulcerans Agy99]MEB3904554.1 lysophospholipid acyltransferase [Mycobacterium ulcerans]MEB3908755.1 lysophospholipid acyltransferase [Mycobacterium ulcerans]MEB3918999.1 lysophospholipid acyltransferase [Mycobacterium ulcerans]MEB3923069.1 lysophospholipid acyltransferase [Mycobacterium ulcerans]